MKSTNKILDLFKKHEGKVFMPFLVIGDPDIKRFKQLAKTIEPYADILEFGIPFSDPIADGPTIQEANVRAFNAGINTDKALDAIEDVRAFTDKPIVVLTYYNILIQGEDTIEASLDKTFKRLKQCGVDGVVIADLPIEEASLVLDACEKYDIYFIFLIAPTTTDDRLAKILKKAKGFIYLISVLGVTGARQTVANITKKTIEKINGKIEKNIPVLVGFGISKPAHVKTIINAGADGIIIGSAIVNKILANLDNFKLMKTEIEKYVKTIKRTLKNEF
jgi:tryptophan synthase alpha chain